MLFLRLDQIGMDEEIEIPVHHSRDIACFRIRPVIFDHGIGMKDIRANLAPKSVLDVRRRQFIEFLLLPLQFELIQFSAQDTHGRLTILKLAAFILACDDDFRGQMGDTDGRIRRIDPLTAVPARTIGVNFQILLVDFHLDGTIDFRNDRH